MRVATLTKHYIKAYAILFVVLTALYFFSRLISIRSLEPFNDEILYAWWAQEGYFHPAQRLISLTDGKQPLFIWLTSIMMRFIPSPLAAGRIVSVISGGLTMIGLGVLSYQLFRSRVAAFFSSLLYILYPQAVVLDRYSLYDSLLGTLWIWNLVIAFWLIRKPTLGVSLVLALTLGAAFLTKSSALFLIPMLLIMAALFSRKRTVLVVLGYMALGVCVSYIYQSVQLLSPSSGAIWGKNSTFIYSLSELSKVSISTLIQTNALLFASWVISYSTVPFLGIAALFTLIDRKNARPYLFLWSAFLIPFITVIGIGKTVYPRHLFFMTLTLLVVGGAAISYMLVALKTYWMKVLMIVVLFFPIAGLSGKIIVHFVSAPLPLIDRFQYIEGWPAGQGVKEIVRYLEGEAQKAPLTVITEGEYGSMTTTAMGLYFGNYPQIQRMAIDDATLDLPAGIDWSRSVYIILNKNQTVPLSWSASELLTIRKGNGNSFMRLLKLVPPAYVRR